MLFSGRISVDEECNLVLFNACNIEAMIAVDVGDGIRGWQITTVPIPCPTGVFHVQPTIFDEIVQTPHVDAVYYNVQRIGLPGGMCQFIFTIALLDSATGLPRDPCEGNLFNTIWHFGFSGCGNVFPGSFFLGDQVASPCGPICPPPPPPGLAAPSSSGRRARGRKIDW